MAQSKEQRKSFHRELIEQLITLSTSGFGLVAALAWNDTIQQFVNDFIEPTIPGSGLISKLIYALLITYQLSKLALKFGVKK